MVAPRSSGAPPATSRTGFPAVWPSMQKNVERMYQSVLNPSLEIPLCLIVAPRMIREPQTAVLDGPGWPAAARTSRACRRSSAGR